MVNIDGKYELVENHNWVPFLVHSGIPEDVAQKLDKTKPVITAKLEGDKLTVDVENSLSAIPRVVYTLGKETEEVLTGVKLKSVATLDNGVLTIKSKGENGKSGERIYTFTATGTEVVLKADGVEAKRIYKRL